MCSEHVSSPGGALLLPVTAGRVQPDDRACQSYYPWPGTGNHRGVGRGGRKERVVGEGGKEEGGSWGERKGGREEGRKEGRKCS